ncbi:MAG: EAL domain-containing protein [Verrucomicrobiota bacterium]
MSNSPDSNPIFKTLIIEDDPVTRVIIAKVFKNRGHTVKTCNRAEEAMEILKADDYPLIVLNLQLPGMNGTQFCNWLKLQPKGEFHYLIVGTASEQPEDLKQIIVAGADDYIAKPYRQDILKVRFGIAEQHVLELLHRKELESQLKNEKDLINTVIESAGALIVVLTPDYKVVRYNRTSRQLSALSEAELMNSTFENAFISDEERERVQNKLRQSKLFSDTIRFDAQLVSKDQQIRYVSWSCSAVYTECGDIRHIVCTGNDITERQKTQEKMTYLAERDSLTGLLNRTRLLGSVEFAIQEVQDGKDYSLIYLDLDNFKMINDTMGGHSAGDRLLVQVAELLLKATRGEDHVFRFGGDEFVVILANTNLTQARQVAERINELLQEVVITSIDDSNRVCNISASIGVSEIKADDKAESIISSSDAACYMAKSRGRNRVELFDNHSEEMQTMETDGDWLNRIQEALHHDRFELWHQPIVNIETDGIAFYETLLRFRDKDGTIVPPTLFLPSVERFGLSKEIDYMVLDKTFSVLGEHPECCFSVNLSGDTISDPNLPNIIEDLAFSKNIDSNQIIIELTESVMISNLGQAEETIRQLTKAGFRFALDDFGKGFSSLSLLKNLPVHIVKIDGSFVRDIVNDLSDRVFVHSINTISHHLKMQTVAEFVETEDCLEILKVLGVNYVQGYYLGRPKRLEQSDWEEEAQKRLAIRIDRQFVQEEGIKTFTLSKTDNPVD